MSEPVPPIWPTHVRHLRIGEVCIDVHYRRVVRPDGQADLPQRMFDLLLLFAAEPDVLHARAELMRRVWPGVVVEDANLSQSVWMLRKALGAPRRDWIRTVAKRGYVFAPPVPVEVLDPLAPRSLMDAETGSGTTPQVDATPPVAAPMPASTRAPQSRSRRWPAALVLAGVAACVIALAASRLEAPPTPATVAAAPVPAAPMRSVTLVQIADPGIAPAARVPAAVLEAWLEWKLGTLPEVIVLTPAHLASDPSAQASNVLVSLMSGPVASGDAAQAGEVFVRAQFTADGRARSIQRQGPASTMASLVDGVSDAVVDALVPTRASAAWPALALEAAHAPRFASMLEARRARRWADVVDIGQDLSRTAPHLGLARLHHAQALAVLGELPAAQAQLQAARTHLQPLSADALAVLDAQHLALTSRHGETAAAYARLARRFPAQSVFHLQHARALGRMGRFADARALLESPRWTRPLPVATQVQRLVNRAFFELSTGDAARSRATAAQAVQLARAAGAGWEHERGHALLARAQAEAVLRNGRSEVPDFEAAAREFERAGDGFSALRARFLADVSGPVDASSPHLDAWLARTRAAGQHQLEFSALRSAAFQQYRAGDLPAYRARLEQAASLADAMEDDWGHAAMGLDLINERFQQGDLAGVERGLAQLEARGVQGELAYWAAFFRVWVALDRGDLAGVASLLDRAPTVLSGSPPPSWQPIAACIRGNLALAGGRPAEARQAYAACDDPTGPVISRMGLAEVDLATGNTMAARAALREEAAALAATRSMPARWAVALDLAALLARAGDAPAARELYADVLPRVQAAGYRRLEAYAQVGLGEDALGRGDLAAARRHATQARRVMAPGTWTPGARIALLEAALARAAGDVDRSDRLLAALDQQAHQRGDATVQATVHSLPSTWTTALDCDPAARRALVARTGLRGISVDWMKLPADPIDAHAAWLADAARNPGR